MGLLAHVSWLDIPVFLALGLCVCWGTISFILFHWFGDRAGAQGGRDFHHANQTPVLRLGGVGLVLSFVVVALAIHFLQSLSLAGETTLGIIVLSSLAMFAL